MLPKSGVRSIIAEVAVTFIASVSILSLYGCRTMELVSTWKDSELYIDRDSSEWQQSPVEIEDKISLSVSNDRDYLYLSLTTHDHEIQRKMLLQGLTVWFDREGGKEKRFGIRYPLGLFGRGFGFERSRYDSPESNPRERFDFTQSELEIIGPGEGERQRFPIKGAKGIDVKIDTTGKIFHYRLKVPLWDTREHPYAMIVKAGQTIGVGIDTGSPEERFGQHGISGIGDGPGNFPGGRRGGAPPQGLGGRGTRGSRQELLTSIKIWMKVRLATRESEQEQ